MATTSAIVSHALGSGLATATIWFPISYFAMRSHFGLRKDLGRAWRPYFSCVILFAILQLLGFRPSTDTPVGLAAFFVVPISICALVLYFTYRAPPDVE